MNLYQGPEAAAATDGSSLADPDDRAYAGSGDAASASASDGSGVAQAASGNPYIDGLLSGRRWSGTVSISFPQSGDQYASAYADDEPITGFKPVTLQQQEAARAAVLGLPLNNTTNVQKYGSVASFTNLALSEAGGLGNGKNGLGDIRLAESTQANPTAYAYYPSSASDGSGGDVWFGDAYAGRGTLDYRNPVLGSYAYHTLIHEIGHALGLKHSNDAGGPSNVAVPADRDDIEFSVMSYRSYIGAGTGGYTYEAYGAPQTYMMLDILALQTMYGADYTAHASATVYRWSPTTGQMFISDAGGAFVGQGIPGGNRVFMTVWDGGGNDTYDLSNYTNAVSIDLRPGQWSVTSDVQRANLGNGHYAQGTVYNSYLFNNNPASLIENATGGAGADVIVGNDANNVLDGGGGADRLDGGLGADRLTGGLGADTFVFKAGYGSDIIADFGVGGDKIDLTGMSSVHSLGDVLARSSQIGADTVIDFGAGDTIKLLNFARADLDSGDFAGLGPDPQAVSANLFFQQVGGAIQMWAMDHSRVIATVALPNPGAAWHAVAVGDFDGDQKADLLLQNESGQAQIWTTDGTALKGAGLVGPNPGPTWHVKAAVDFNGDGKSDILWQNDDGQAAVWTLDGTRLISAGAVGPDPGSSWHVAGSGDFNGDGKSDILWQNDEGQAGVWTFDGGARLVSAAVVGPNPGSSWHVAGSGDFNGDGKSDILWQNESGQAAVWTMNDVTLISAGAVGPNPGATWHIKGAADVNGDGHSDILWQSDGGQPAVWFMDGTTLLGGSNIGPNPGSEWHLI